MQHGEAADAESNIAIGSERRLRARRQRKGLTTIKKIVTTTISPAILPTWPICCADRFELVAELVAGLAGRARRAPSPCAAAGWKKPCTMPKRTMIATMPTPTKDSLELPSAVGEQVDAGQRAGRPCPG